MKAWIIVVFVAIALVLLKNATSQGTGQGFTGLGSQRGTFGTSTDIGQPG
jgi:preprotein translocase subunit SecG